VLALPTAYLMLVAAYLHLITWAAWFFRAPAPADAAEARIALLVPAHNESHQIATILRQARAARWPEEQFDLVVVADNCTDDTAEIARAEGAQVLERSDTVRQGKGHALDWALREHSEVFREADIIALIDADMEVSPQFFAALAGAFLDPDTQVVQGLNTVARPEASWRTALGFVAFTTINHVRPAGRDALGGTAELKGSGMAFRAPLLLEYGWPAHTLAEDAEFSKRLLEDGIRVRYQPHAKVISAIPERLAQANVQQERWEGGKLQLVKAWLPRLLRLLIRKPGIRHADAVLDMLVPPMSVLALLLVLCFAGGLLIHPYWAGAVVLAGLAVAWCILSGLLLQRAPLRIWLYLAAVPLFIAWKIPLYARLLLFRKGPAQWNRTPRDQEIDR